VAGHGELQSSTQRKTIDGRNERLAGLLNAVKHQGLSAGGQGLAFFGRKRRKLRDVRAGNKGLFSGAGKHHGPNSGMRVQTNYFFVKFLQDRRIQRVQLCGAVDGDHGHAVLDFSDEVRHASKLPLKCGISVPSATKR
jgi:hypothetical protein